MTDFERILSLMGGAADAQRRFIDAFHAGADSARNGPNPANSHFSWPGSIVFTDGPPTIIQRPVFKIRVTGPDIDISLAVVCQEDIEIIEKLLAKLRASLSANVGTSTGESK